jgi:putative FmdB family regulatory protein
VPTYEYACSSCGAHIDVFQRFSEESLSVCGVCGGSLRKVFHPAGILFKGSGFYATDSRSGSKAKDTGERVTGDAGVTATSSESTKKAEPSKPKEKASPGNKKERSA